MKKLHTSLDTPRPANWCTHKASLGHLHTGDTHDLLEFARLSATPTAATIARHCCAYAVVALHFDGPPRSPPQQSPAKRPWFRVRAVSPRPECLPEMRSRHARKSDNRSDGQTS